MSDDLKDGLLKAMGSISSLDLFGGWSEEQKKFMSSGYKCSNCNKVLFTALTGITSYLYFKDGTKANSLSLVLNRYGARDLILKCPSCSYCWNLYGNSNSITPNQVEFLGIEETHRLTEDLGTDTRLIDNSKSTSKITRKFTISREWSKTYLVQYENTKTNSTELNLQLKVSEVEFGGIKQASQTALKTAYSISEVKKEIFTDDVQIDVSEHQKVNVFFAWKSIWQYGSMKFRYQNNMEFDIPFKVSVGVTFDQTQIDE